MLPSVWPGDQLTIQSAAHEEVVPGDIVLILRNHRFFVHRLVEKRQGRDCLWWITRGDTMLHNDPPATGADLLGRVAWIRRRNRNFVPSRRIKLVHRAVGWILRHSDRLRNLSLRFHAACLQEDLMPGGQPITDAFAPAGGIPVISRFRTSDL